MLSLVNTSSHIKLFNIKLDSAIPVPPIYTQIHWKISHIDCRIAPERSTEKLHARFCADGENEYTL